MSNSVVGLVPAPAEAHGAGPSVGGQPPPLAHQQPQMGQQGWGGAWEGDSTLHSYCYDYMRKRGWTQTASAFAADAGIDEQQWQGPPIEAPQGLLYEWWTVFWDVFIARNQKTGQRNHHAEAYVEAMRHKHSPLLVSFPANSNAPPLALPRSLAHSARPTGPLGPTLAPGGPRANPIAAQNHVLEQQQIQRDMQQRAAQAAAQAQAGGMRPPGQPQQAPYGPGTSQSPAPGGMHPGQQHHLMGGPQGGPLAHPGQPLAQQQMQQYQQQQQHPGAVQGYPNQPLSLHGSPHLAHALPPGQFNPNGPPQRGQAPMGQGPPRLELPGADGRGPLAPVFQQCMVAVGLEGRDPQSLSNEELNAVAGQMRRLGAIQTLGPQQPGPGGPQAQPQMIQVGAQGGMRGQQPQGVRVPSGQGQRFDQPPPGHVPQRMMSGPGPNQQQQLSNAQQQYAQQQQQHQHQLMQHHQQRMGQPPQQRPPGAHEHLQQMQYSPASPSHYPTPSAGPPAQSPYASTPFGNHPAAPSPAPNGSVAASPGAFNQPLPPPAAPAGRGAGAKRGAAAAGGTKMSPAPSKGRGAAGAQAQAQAGDDPSPRSRKRARGLTKDEESIVANGMPTPGDMAGAPGQFEGASPAMSLNGAHTPMGPPGGVPYRPSPSPANYQNGADGMIHSDGNQPISRPGSSASNYLNLSAQSQQQPGGGPGQSPQLHISIPPGAQANGQYLNSAGPESAGPRPFAVSNASSLPIPPRPMSQAGNRSTQPSPMGTNMQQLDHSPHGSQQDGINAITIDPNVFSMPTGGGGESDDPFAGLDLDNLGGGDFNFDELVNGDLFGDEGLGALS